MSATDFAKAIQRMLAITDTGLTYTKDSFDRERYEDLRQILSSILQDQTELNQEELTAILKPTGSYATPLMDVRAWIVFKTRRFVWLEDKERILGHCLVALVR